MAKTGRAFFQRAILGSMLLCITVFLFFSEGQAETANEPGIFITGGEITEAPPESPAEIPVWDVSIDIIGINDIIFQPETGPVNVEETIVKDAATHHDLDKLRDFDYLITQFYASDYNTGLLPGDIDVDLFLRTDLTIDDAPGPKVLIFHTHSTEMYADSILRETAYATDPMEGVMGAGAELAKILKEKHGIAVLHHVGRYDIVNGMAQISGAYERMEPSVRQLLADNPSIKMAIDLHRDGLRDGVPPMVADINGQQTARLMFVNGLSRTKQGENHYPVPWLENPYLTENLLISFRMQLAANEYYPGLMRKVYLKPYRYSLHVLPHTLLVEAGAQNNTKQEAYAAMALLADVIAKVLKT
jgi:stage II sporulation protein P